LQKPVRKKKVRKQKQLATSQPPKSAQPEERRLLISELCEILEKYLDRESVADVYRAYLFGAQAHEGQRRKTGEPYIYHPLEVARILAGMQMDGKSIIAAILHDVIEDTESSKDQVEKEFGKDVAELVDGVSTIGQIKFSSKEEEQAENFRKMLLAMSRDIRVILIKLADRMHNMRTLGVMSREKQRRIARETLEIYAPIANRLGVRQWAYELERLSFSILYPLRYAVLKQTMKERQGNRKAIVSKVGDTIVSRLEAEGISGDVTGREKHLYSIYRKMKEKSLTFDEIYDVYAFRITVDKVDTCYRVLGVIHSLFKPIPGRFKDYLAIPKANGYQSLHTIVFGPYGLSLEIQIRTEEMHRVADVGVAAHWLYKSGVESDGKVQQQALQWLKDLLDIQQKAGNSSEFLEHLKIDLFPDEVYVFTPQGEIKKLPRDVTVVDFAYDVHTDIGNRCIGAKVNHKLVPLRTQLKNGDHVEIITSEWGRPTPSWLNYVVTSRARAHIRAYLKSQKNEESSLLGARLFDKAVTALGFDLEGISEDQKNRLLKKLQLKDWSHLMEEIGIGNRVADIVARQLVSDMTTEIDDKKVSGLAINGTEGVVVTYAKCCRPVPGDPVLGYLSAGKGVVIHAADCPNVAKFQKHPERWLDVHWEKEISGVFQAAIRVESRNEKGALASVASAISEMNANIDSVSFEGLDGQFSAMNFIIDVRDRVHLAKVIKKIRALENVIRINRVKG